MNESETNQNMEQKCPQCGGPLPSGVLAGLCPACLLKQGVAADTGAGAGPEAAPFQPPTVEEIAWLFPQLEILALIGKGGMGAVYKARQPALDRMVALKILPPQTAAGPGFVERFNREARALARLNHPNIVGVYEFGQASGLSFFIMEFVDGLNLRELERAGKLSPREALQIVPQICEALQFAHDEGIVHRDIKPENILLDKKGRVKIADFGIAKILGGGSEPDLTKTQGVVGTPHYMAPEQMEKPTAVDHRADIFSLGVVFYEMLTGELPLGKFGPPSSRKVEVDVRLDDVVLRTLERDPERRYQHASQVKTAVDTIAGTAAPPPASAVNAAAIAREILARDYNLKIGSCLRRGWNLLKGEFWPFVGITALFLALFSVASSFGGASFTHETGGNSVLQTGSAVSMLVYGPLFGGLAFYFLKKVRREPATVETAFCGFGHRFLHVFLAGFVTALLITLGFVCFLLPGIYLFVAWMFTLPLVMDKGLDFWSAMELSRKVVSRHWFKCFGLAIILLLLPFAGILALIVGVFVMLPLVFATSIYAYEDIFGGVTGTSPAPAATGPTGTIVMPAATATPPRAAGGTWTPATKVGLAAVALVLGVCLLMALHQAHCLFNPGVTQPEAVSAQSSHAGFSAPSAVSLSLPAAPAPVPIAGVDRAPAPGFTPVVELELTNFASLNLASGEQKMLPQFVVEQAPGDGKGMAIVAWMEGAGTDFAYADGCGYSMLLGLAYLKRDSWEQTSPDEVVAALQKTGKDMGNNFPATVSDSPTNYTYGFQTRSGKVGLLQFLTFTSVGPYRSVTQSGSGTLTQDFPEHTVTPPAVKIRYKFFEPTVAQAALGGTIGNDMAEVLAERLEAASGITDVNEKDKPLAAVALDAAKAGQAEIVKKALAQMLDLSERSATTHDAALLLAKQGLRKPAIEMAKAIPDLNVRDQTLSELAQ